MKTVFVLVLLKLYKAEGNPLQFKFQEGLPPGLTTINLQQHNLFLDADFLPRTVKKVKNVYAFRALSYVVMTCYFFSAKN